MIRLTYIFCPEGAIVQVGSKFDVRPVSVRRRPSVSRFSPISSAILKTEPLFGQLKSLSEP